MSTSALQSQPLNKQYSILHFTIPHKYRNSKFIFNESSFPCVLKIKIATKKTISKLNIQSEQS